MIMKKQRVWSTSVVIVGVNLLILIVMMGMSESLNYLQEVKLKENVQGGEDELK